MHAKLLNNNSTDDINAISAVSSLPIATNWLDISNVKHSICVFGLLAYEVQDKTYDRINDLFHEMDSLKY